MISSLLPFLPRYRAILFSLLLLSLPVVAEQQAEGFHPDDLEILQRLNVELQNRQRELPRKIKELEKNNKLVEPWLLDQAGLNVRLSRLQQDNLKLEQRGVQEQLGEIPPVIEALRERLEIELQNALDIGGEGDNPVRVTELKAELAQQGKKLEEASQRLNYLKVRLAQVETQLYLDEQWRRALQGIYQAQQEKLLTARTQDKRQQQLVRIEDLNRRLASLKQSGQDSLYSEQWLQFQIRAAEARLHLIEHVSRLERMEDELARIDGDLENLEPGGESMARTLENIVRMEQEAATLKSLLGKKQQVFSQQQNLLSKMPQKVDSEQNRLFRETLDIYQLLRENFQEQETRATELVKRTAELRESLYQSQVEKKQEDLFIQRSLPLLLQNRESLVNEIFLLPKLCYQHLLGLWRVVGNYPNLLNMRYWSLLGFLVLLWGGLLWWARRLVCNSLNRLEIEEQGGFSHTTLINLTRLLRGNLVGLALLGVFLAALYVFDIRHSAAWNLFFLFLIWLGIRLEIQLAWLLLASPELPKERDNLPLYRLMRGLLIAGGFFASITYCLHSLPVSQELRDFNDSLFMLFLSLTVLPALQIRALALDYFQQQVVRAYWLLIMRLLTLLLPLSILAVGLLGILGYINLGWAVAGQLSLFLLVLAVWLILRGFLEDVATYFKNLAMLHTRHSLLWTQDLIPLLHTLLRFALFFLALWIFWQLSGWRDYTPLVRRVLEYQLFSLGQSHITPKALLLSLLVLYLVLWLGSWIRQISYRWVYTYITDLGLRHSLSVFTQYAVVLIGLLIVLQISGLNLTTLTVFAGALGVGLGFGLQNIANNFISGFLLLAERPLRTGDYVDVGGGAVGEVTRIGFRALIIKNWDNQEVILPNTQVITSPFTNWTHSNDIMRTVLYLRIAYGSDLTKTQKILEGVLSRHADVLAEPEFEVLLWEMAESAVIFRINYYTNLRKSWLLRVRSEIHFAFVEVLEKAGIRIPFPQRDIYIKEAPSPLEYRHGEADNPD